MNAGRYAGRYGALALGIWIAFNPARAAEPYVLYDDFVAAPINPSRWTDFERSRAVSGNALRHVERDWGGTSSDAGSTGGNLLTNLARGGPVTQLRATVRVAEVDMTGCAANPTPTRVAAFVNGSFFNTGNRTPGGVAGDVIAQFELFRDTHSGDPPGVLRVEGRLSMCIASGCGVGAKLLGSVGLGTVSSGTNALLQIDWDRPNKRFLVSRDKGAPMAIAYDVDDSADPGNLFKAVGTYTVVANCASGPRAYGYVDVKFDNVAVNAAAKP